MPIFDQLASIPRPINDPHLWMTLRKPKRQLRSAHAFHDYISKSQVDCCVVRTQQVERDPAVFGLHNRKAMLNQHLPRQRAHQRVILDQKNGFPIASWWESLGVAFASNSQFVFSARQIDLECRPATRFAVDPDVTSALFDDSIHRRQTKTGALSQFFGCKEWLKDTSNRSLVHAASVVADRQQDVLARG